MSELGGFWLLGLMVLVCLIAGGGYLVGAAGFARRVRAAGPGAIIGAAAPMLRISRDGALEATAEARALLGLAEEGALCRFTLLSGIRAGRKGFDAALARLMNDGMAFRTVLETGEGRILEAVGAPAGVDVAVTLHDQTCAARRAREAEIRAERAERALADLEAARAAAGVVAWRPAEDGPGDEYGFAALPRRARSALEMAARRGEAGRLTIGPAPGEKAAEFDLVATKAGLFVARDAAATAAAERAMSRFVDTISETFAHLKVGLMIFDADRRLSLFNPVGAALCGERPEWLAQNPTLRALLDRMRKARARPEQAAYPAWRARLLARVAGEVAEPFEETWHLPDGRTMMAIFRPHAAGGLAFVIEDVTESLALRRINAVERAARDATTEMLREGIAVFGPDGRLRIRNRAFERLLGFPDRAPAPGSHVDDVVAICRGQARPHPFWPAMLAAASGGGERRVDAERLEMKDGRFLAARVSPMPDGATLAVFSDVTASQRMAGALRERNEALEQAEEMRGALIDQISHQMRTPLNSLFGFGQLLAEGVVGPLNPVQTEYVQGVVTSSRELLKAVDAMADLVALGPGAPEERAVAFGPAVSFRDSVALAF
ncbi:MAG: PAS-domain containing protein, partial [Pikeienuella sp.]